MTMPLFRPLALILTFFCTSAIATSPVHYAVNVFFSEGSSLIEGAQLDRLEQLTCRLGNASQVFAVGHASPLERNQDKLAEARVDAVKRWMIESARFESKQILAESKGATQPVASSSTSLTDAKNRRVEIEGRPASYSTKSGRDCELLEWQKALLAPEPTAALVVARALLQTGRANTVALYAIALQKKRQDLIDAFSQRDSGIALNRNDAAQVAKMAVEGGSFEYAKNWVLAEIRRFSSDQASELYLSTCRSKASEGERALFARFLVEQRLGISDGRALHCAVTESRSASLAAAYLSAGSAKFITAEMVVQSGYQPKILDLLLANGADPKSRTDYGTTLFHTVRLSTVDDVKRLLNWGLDINAKGRTFPSNPETTPLEQASSHAKIEVLDFMKQAGATVKDQRIQFARPNVEAQAWLVRNGISIPQLGNELIILAAQEGQSTAPVFLALKERGIDLNTPNIVGSTALGTAIERYSVDLVRALISMGVSVQKPTRTISRAIKSPLDSAEALSAQSCVWSGTSSSCFASQDLAQRKSTIIQVLKLAGA